MKEKEKNSQRAESNEELKKRAAQQILQKAMPRENLLAPDNKLSKFVFRIVDNKYFDVVISICILLNTVALAVPFYNMPDQLNTTLDNINYFFVAVLLLRLYSK